MNNHNIDERLGEDSLGFEYVRCVCGITYPESADTCPHAPSEMKVNVDE